MANKVRIISVGKPHDAKFKVAIEDYQQRLRPLKLEWKILPPKTEATLADTVASETHSILQTLKPAEYVFLLDERGATMTSELFSSTLATALATYKDVSFVIGGAYGVSDQLRDRANTVLAFGPMVMPHQLVRLVLTEQLYRAVSIAAGTKYHHGD
jgi:23S rRNA (pseudouridine1915-N3)-methyltransferase